MKVFNIKYINEVFLLRPEAKWSSHKQVENFGGLNSCMWKNTGMIYD